MLDATIEVVDGVMIVSPKELFEPENGDIVANNGGEHIFLCKDYIGEGDIYAYLGYDFELSRWFKEGGWFADRYATEEEKKKLFDKLAEEGWEWKPDTKELVKLKWKPKDDEPYFYPSMYKCDFVVNDDKYENHSLDICRYAKGWCFKTQEECQEFCNRLNQAIEGVKP